MLELTWRCWPGGNIWQEKLDYTVSWLTAHIQDAGQLGKPLVTEEFGKAISAAKVYTGELPKSPQKGEALLLLLLLLPLLLLLAEKLARWRCGRWQACACPCCGCQKQRPSCWSTRFCSQPSTLAAHVCR